MLRQWFVSLTLFTALFLLAGCLPATTPPSPASLFTRQGEPFTLRLGEKARLTDADLEISFETLVVDGRCPTDALCAESAPVQVDVKVQRVGFSVWSILRLSAHTDGRGRVLSEPAAGALPSGRYGPAIIALLSVTPYPTTAGMRPRDYAITLLVTPQAEDTPTPVAASQLPRAALGEPFVVQQGQTVALDENQMRVTFEEVTRDSRCPADVICAWSGIVDVQLRVEMTGHPAQQMRLGGATNSEGVVLGPVVEASGPTAAWYADYTITLQQVTPYPAHANPSSPPEAYAVTLLVATAAFSTTTSSSAAMISSKRCPGQAEPARSALTSSRWATRPFCSMSSTQNDSAGSTSMSLSSSLQTPNESQSPVPQPRTAPRPGV